MTIEEAIKKAKLVGYVVGGERTPPDTSDDILYAWSEEQVFLDPSFWQSLGKALEWVDLQLLGYEAFVKNTDQGTGVVKFDEPIKDYLYHWHRFIDHLAEGNAPETFFESL